MPLFWKPRLFYPALYKNANPPVVVGATGGSGTRVFQAILQHAGLFMGQHLNHAGDAMDLEPFLDRWINPLLETTGRVGFDVKTLPASMRGKCLKDLGQSLKTYCAHLPIHGLWGWKNPRSMYVLPLIHHFFPDVRFIHVVRDGRDMAFSDNQNQRNKHYAALFGTDATNDTPQQGAAASAQLWARANGQIASWGVQNLGERYYQIRLEDLCAHPEAEIGMLFGWLGTPANPQELAALVSPPSSLGRWRRHETNDISVISAAAQEGLQLFRYLDAQES